GCQEAVQRGEGEFEVFRVFLADDEAWLFLVCRVEQAREASPGGRESSHLQEGAAIHGRGHALPMLGGKRRMLSRAAVYHCDGGKAFLVHNSRRAWSVRHPLASNPSPPKRGRGAFKSHTPARTPGRGAGKRGPSRRRASSTPHSGRG